MATPRAVSAGARAVVACLTPLFLLLLPVTHAAAAPPAPGTHTSAAAATDPLDTTDQAAIAAAYRDVYLPASVVTAPAPAADAASRCAPGSTPGAVQDATLTLVNYVRRMSGVPTVTLNNAYSSAAQQAALMMYANQAVSPSPPPSWRCWKEAGADAAAHSDLSSAAAGAAVVREYMDDSGPDHTSATRRTRLQKPNVSSIGNGTVGGYNALWVTTTQGPGGSPTYTTWPSGGYFPDPLEPAGRWSLTTWDPDNILDRAAVAVTGPDGRPVAVTSHSVGTGAGASVVFELGTLPVPAGNRVDTYTVTVSGITNRWGDTLDDYTYPVQLFDPTSTDPGPPVVQVDVVTPATVGGTPRVGEVLTASAPTWSPADASTTYQWLRDGTPVPGATGTSYLLGAADVGARISVRSTGDKPGCTPGTSVSAGSALVTKAPATLDMTASSTAPGQAHLAVTVSAAVPVIGGSVDLSEGGYPVASDLPVTNGTATFDGTGLSPGPHTWTAAYSGDGSVSPATTSTTVTVADAASAGLTVTASSAAVGELALDVAVRADGRPAAGGTVTVAEGARTLRSGIAVSAGTARYQASRLTPGRHTLTVRYSGTRLVKSSTTTITTTVRAKVKPVVKVSGQSTAKGRLKITVGLTAPGQVRLGGTVKITEGTKTLRSTVTVSKGRATWTGTKIKKGRHKVTVTYRGTSQVTSGKVTRTVTVR